MSERMPIRHQFLMRNPETLVFKKTKRGFCDALYVNMMILAANDVHRMSLRQSLVQRPFVVFEGDFILRHGLANSFKSPFALTVVESVSVGFGFETDDVLQAVVSAFILSEKRGMIKSLPICFPSHFAVKGSLTLRRPRTPVFFFCI